MNSDDIATYPARAAGRGGLCIMQSGHLQKLTKDDIYDNQPLRAE